jgi:hypothetical protein
VEVKKIFKAVSAILVRTFAMGSLLWMNRGAVVWKYMSSRRASVVFGIHVGMAGHVILNFLATDLDCPCISGSEFYNATLLLCITCCITNTRNDDCVGVLGRSTGSLGSSAT